MRVVCCSPVKLQLLLTSSATETEKCDFFLAPLPSDKGVGAADFFFVEKSKLTTEKELQEMNLMLMEDGNAGRIKRVSAPPNRTNNHCRPLHGRSCCIAFAGC